MKKQKTTFFVLLVSFVLGLSMISSGLASLPEPYAKSRTVILNPNLDQLIRDLRPETLVDDETISTYDLPQPKPDDNKRLHTIKRGQTLAGILQNYNIDAMEVAEATSELDDHFKLRNMRAGEKLDIELSDAANGKKHLKSMKFKPSITRNVEMFADENGSFKVKIEEIKLQKILLKASGSISGSFYQSAVNAGITPSVVGQLITALSYDIDFQRDIQPGNKFTILFEGMTTPKGEFIKSNRPLYVKMEMKKKVVEMYIVPRTDGTLGYYHADGSSARKALLRTPVDGVRITSGFGMRRHPILGYSKMHKGIDFGAPTGTPIYAAGDATVEIAGYSGGYGNYVRLKHNGTYSTAYAHMSRYAKGIKPGVKVSQGQIIGYVGTTGRSTGAHLHYEILQKGIQINPISVNLPIENKLNGNELARFQQEKRRIVAAISDAPTRSELAELINQEGGIENIKNTQEEAAAKTNVQTDATAAEEPKTAAPVAKKATVKKKAANKAPEKKTIKKKANAKKRT